MNWHMPTGPQSIVSVASAVQIVLSRVEYIAQHGSQCNQQKLLGEAIEYARLLRRWVHENEPVYGRKDDGNRHGKPGPMSDG
jgi:predicted RNA polymerase sigma factor